MPETSKDGEEELSVHFRHMGWKPGCSDKALGPKPSPAEALSFESMTAPHCCILHLTQKYLPTTHSPCLPRLRC